MKNLQERRTRVREGIIYIYILRSLIQIIYGGLKLDIHIMILNLKNKFSIDAQV